MRQLMIILIMSPLIGWSQELQIVPEVTYSTYSMSDMKKFQSDYIRDIGLPAKAVTSFPGYGGFGTSLIRNIDKLDIAYGIFFNYNTTGGRVSYEDYSGSVTMDQVMTSYSLGALFQCQINKPYTNKWPLYFAFNASWARTNMSLTETFILGSQSSPNHYNLMSNNISIRPSFILKKKIKRIIAQAGVGYEIQIPGKLYFDNGSPFQGSADWSGLRFSLGLGLVISKRPDKSVTKE